MDSILQFRSLVLHGFLVPFDLLLALCDCSDTISANSLAASEHPFLSSSTFVHGCARDEMPWKQCLHPNLPLQRYDSSTVTSKPALSVR